MICDYISPLNENKPSHGIHLNHDSQNSVSVNHDSQSTKIANHRVRPVSSIVTDVMNNLEKTCEKDGLGRLKQVERTNVFYKCLPCNATDEALEQYKINRDLYLQRFKERAPLNVVSKEHFDKLLKESPERADGLQQLT